MQSVSHFLKFGIVEYGDKALTALGRKHWLGDGRLFRGATAQKLEESVPGFKWINNAINAAPSQKWMLSIVPLMDLSRGNPPVEKIDLKQTLALATTGGIWSIYSLLIYPRGWLLFACNVSLFGVHAYNISRKWRAQSANNL